MAVGMVLRGTGIMQERVPTLSGEMSRTDLRDTLNYVANGASFEGWVAEVERYARKILAEAGHDPERPCGMPTPVEDGSTLAIAHEVLRWIRIARNNIKQGNAADAGLRASGLAAWSGNMTSVSSGKRLPCAGKRLLRDQRLQEPTRLRASSTTRSGNWHTTRVPRRYSTTCKHGPPSCMKSMGRGRSTGYRAVARRRQG
jgi:hypothetical protein